GFTRRSGRCKLGGFPHPSSRQDPMAFWLAKTEPDECSIDDFARAPQTPIRWDGGRNFQARNYLGQMSVGDLVFIYHSSSREIGIAGIASFSTAAYPDPSQFDTKSAYNDPKGPEDELSRQSRDLILQNHFTGRLPVDGIKSLDGQIGLPLV